MLKQLRLKFILINMTIVTIMLTAIFIFMYMSTSNNLERESIRMMEQVGMNPMQMAPPDFKKQEIRIPYMIIKTDSDGKILETGGGYFDLSDTDSINILLKTVNDSGQRNGKIEEYNLRYSKFSTPDGEIIIFGDMTNEKAALHNLIEGFVAVGAVAYVLFLGISVLLAKWAVRPVEQAWKQQKQFIADASHELKTPLTVIMTNSELLNSDNCTNENKKRYSENILSMSKQMRGLVENLLDMARLDNGKQKENYKDLSFSELTANEAMTFEPIFFEKGMTFSYEIEENITVNGNEQHLKQLVAILLDNASKYASPGGETVLKLKTVQPKHCQLEVANQGEKLSDEELRDIFKRFYKADKARTMNNGFGLGLSIAQSVAEEHGGRITAESKDGWNSFIVTLPIKKT